MKILDGLASNVEALFAFTKVIASVVEARNNRSNFVEVFTGDQRSVAVDVGRVAGAGQAEDLHPEADQFG